MKKRKLIYNLVFRAIITLTILRGQFSDINIDVELGRISESERQILTTLRYEINNYYLDNHYSEELEDLSINIDFLLIIESVSSSGNQFVINAQAFISNKSDQNYYAKGIQFPYKMNQKIQHNFSFDPLSSLLDYFAYLLIAAELDTWSYLDGTMYYNKAIEVSDFGKNSDWKEGWQERWRKARNLKNNQYLRSMRYNYFLVIDELRNEEINKDLIFTSMATFCEDLIMMDGKIGSNKEALKFLDVYHNNISELLFAVNQLDCIEKLLNYDYKNKKTYEPYLKK